MWPPSATRTEPVMKLPASEASSKSGPESLAEPALRDAADLRLPGLGREEVAVEVGFHITRRQRVHADAVARPFQRVLARQLDQRRLRGRIGRHARALSQAKDRGDVDDRSRSPRRHQPSDNRDRHAPRAVEVHAHDPRPFIVGLLEGRARRGNAAVVHQQVDRSAGQRLGLRNGLAHAVGVGHVERDHCGARQIGGQRLHGGEPAGGQDDPCPRRGEATRELRAKRARGASDERHAAV